MDKRDENINKLIAQSAKEAGISDKAINAGQAAAEFMDNPEGFARFCKATEHADAEALPTFVFEGNEFRTSFAKFVCAFTKTMHEIETTIAERQRNESRWN